MKYEVPGQDDVTLDVGHLEDKTLSIVVTTTHVRLKNMDVNQSVMYTEINPVLNPPGPPPVLPSYPDDWKRLDPGQELTLKVPLAPNDPPTYLYLRKKTWFRPPLTNRTRTDMLDTPVTVRVEGIDLS